MRRKISLFMAMHPYSAGGGYVNMIMDEGEERVKAAYGDNYTRLPGESQIRSAESLPCQSEYQTGGVTIGLVIKL